MIDSHTRLYGVIGNPVQHSLSPVLHNWALRKMNWNAVYLAFRVNHLEAALSGMRALPVYGLSVTLPFKTQVIPFLDDIEGVAGKIHAVNTLLNKDGKLIGFNTDWRGAMEALKEKIPLEGKTVVLLGAGGAARAIGFGLKENACEVIIVNRHIDRAINLAKELRCDCVPASSLEGLKADVVINATSVGMHPCDQESPLPRDVLKEEMTVMDIVYSPLRTRLLRDAGERGCRIIDGLEMFIRQGILQLELWTGTKPDTDGIREHLCAALAARSRGGERG